MLSCDEEEDELVEELEFSSSGVDASDCGGGGECRNGCDEVGNGGGGGDDELEIGLPERK